MAQAADEGTEQLQRVLDAQAEELAAAQHLIDQMASPQLPPAGTQTSSCRLEDMECALKPVWAIVRCQDTEIPAAGEV